MTHNVEQNISKGKMHFSSRRQGHFSASRKRGKSLRVLNGKEGGKGFYRVIETGVGGGKRKRQWLSPEGPKGDKDREEAAADRQTCQSSQAKAGLSNGERETRKGGRILAG